MNFEGIFKRFLPFIAGRNQNEIRCTNAESLAICQTEAPAHDRTRAGRMFNSGYGTYNFDGSGTSTEGSGNNGADGFPITSEASTVMGFWNNDYNKTYYFEEIGVLLQSVTGTGTPGGSLWIANFKAPILNAATGVQTLAILGSTMAVQTCINNSNGGLQSNMLLSTPTAGTGKLVITNPATPNWYCICQSQNTNINTFPGTWTLENRNLQGGVVVPPQTGLALGVFNGNTMIATYSPFARWYEIESDLE